MTNDASVERIVLERAKACTSVEHAPEFKAEALHPDCPQCAGVVFQITQPYADGDKLWLTLTATRDGKPIETDPDRYGWIGLSDECWDGVTHDWGQALQEAIIDVVLHR